MTTPTINAETQGGRILLVLMDGGWHTTAEIHRRAGYSRLNSRVAELRKKGHAIECESVPGETGARGYRYRWTNPVRLSDSWSPPATGSTGNGHTHRNDEEYPRTPENRFRVYALKAGALLELVDAVPTAEEALILVAGLAARSVTPGVLDCKGADCDDEGPWDTGQWLVNPWALEKAQVVA